ncbi:hypothetical protein KC19_VG045500 [Ceratodon purpureus]|uniref:Uncharacterized protein n=1 Tax=Ceratodon purpureus TaxID=3225 RepID=A0A8T0HLU6_CERPU|nr:hypothetical protein KC19_VG045500 [Ceratodon purpureus]
MEGKTGAENKSAKSRTSDAAEEGGLTLIQLAVAYPFTPSLHTPTTPQVSTQKSFSCLYRSIPNFSISTCSGSAQLLDKTLVVNQQLKTADKLETRITASSEKTDLREEKGGNFCSVCLAGRRRSLEAPASSFDALISSQVSLLPLSQFRQLNHSKTHKKLESNCRLHIHSQVVLVATNLQPATTSTPKNQQRILLQISISHISTLYNQHKTLLQPSGRWGSEGWIRHRHSRYKSRNNLADPQPRRFTTSPIHNQPRPMQVSAQREVAHCWSLGNLPTVRRSNCAAGNFTAEKPRLTHPFTSIYKYRR